MLKPENLKVDNTSNGTKLTKGRGPNETWLLSWSTEVGYTENKFVSKVYVKPYSLVNPKS